MIRFNDDRSLPFLLMFLAENAVSTKINLNDFKEHLPEKETAENKPAEEIKEEKPTEEEKEVL